MHAARVTVHGAPTAEHLRAAGALFACEPPLGRYTARVLELVERARVHGTSDECGVLVATDPQGGDVLGAATFGLTAGARGAGALHGVMVAERARRSGVGRRLVAAVADSLRTRDARFLAAEVAADPRLDAYHALLAACGFVEEARVDGYFSDDVALVIWCRRWA